MLRDETLNSLGQQTKLHKIYANELKQILQADFTSFTREVDDVFKNKSQQEIPIELKIIATKYEYILNQKGFPVASSMENKLRDFLSETFSIPFKSEASEFARGVFARSVYIYIKTFLELSLRDSLENRSFVFEIRRGGFGGGSFSNYASRRGAGETGRKLIRDKSQFTLNLDKIFDESLIQVLKSSKTNNVPTSLVFKQIKASGSGVTYPLVNNQGGFRLKTKNNYIVREGDEFFNLITEEEL